MSSEAVNQFLQKVSEDNELQQELAQTLQAEGGRTEATSALAAKYGYDFTPEELLVAIEQRESEFQQLQEAGELNEDELEAVAGGQILPFPIPTLPPTFPTIPGPGLPRIRVRRW